MYFSERLSSLVKVRVSLKIIHRICAIENVDGSIRTDGHVFPLMLNEPKYGLVESLNFSGRFAITSLISYRKKFLEEVTIENRYTSFSRDTISGTLYTSP